MKNEILYILKNREQYPQPIKSERFRQILKDRFGIECSDTMLRDVIRKLCLEDNYLTGGTKDGFILAETESQANEVVSWSAYRIKPLQDHVKHLEKLIIKQFGEQETLF